jgi:hypothetical protein
MKAVILLTAFLVLAWQVLSYQVKKEAATSSMILTLFDSPRLFPKAVPAGGTASISLS